MVAVGLEVGVEVRLYLGGPKLQHAGFSRS
jgi:tRNA splicing endonuclease